MNQNQPQVRLEQYYPIWQKIDVSCETSNCQHFGHCAQIPTEIFCFEPGKIDFFFVGQGGGEEEERTQTPFIGGAGQRLRSIVEWMLRTGLRFSVAFSNSVRCRPTVPNTNPRKNRDPYQEELERCYRYLDRDIAKLKPGCVVPLGNSSTKALIPNAIGKISKDHGNFYKVQMWSRRQLMMPTYHPSFLIRNGRNFNIDSPNPYDINVRDDLCKALNYMEVT